MSPACPVYVNDGFTELTGYDAGHVLGRNCRFLRGPATKPGDIATLSHALRAGRDITVVMHNYRMDGSVFLNEISISPIRDPGSRSPKHRDPDRRQPTGETSDLALRTEAG